MKKCAKLVINKNLQQDARATKYKILNIIYFRIYKLHRICTSLNYLESTEESQNM